MISARVAAPCLAMFIAWGWLTMTDAESARSRVACGQATGDYACKVKGAASATPQGGSQAPLHVRRATGIAPQSILDVYPRGILLVQFASQARCRVGPTSSTSRLLTRVDSEHIFSFLTGYATCVFPATGTKIYACNHIERCPALITINGGRDVIRRTQDRSFRAGSTTTVSDTMFSICSGDIDIKIEDSSGYASISGYDSDPDSQTRVHIVTSTTIDDDGNVTASSTDLETTTSSSLIKCENAIFV
jgi:hypothetical protein